MKTSKLLACFFVIAFAFASFAPVVMLGGNAHASAGTGEACEAGPDGEC